mgnify:FL=1
MLKYRNSSNYANTVVNRKFLELYNPTITINNLSDRIISFTLQAKYDRRPDLLAQDMYGNSRLWWVFTHYNRDKLRDPIMDFKAGIEIEAPKEYKPSGVN